MATSASWTHWWCLLVRHTTAALLATMLIGFHVLPTPRHFGNSSEATASVAVCGDLGSPLPGAIVHTATEATCDLQVYRGGIHTPGRCCHLPEVPTLVGGRI